VMTWTTQPAGFALSFIMRHDGCPTPESRLFAPWLKIGCSRLAASPCEVEAAHSFAADRKVTDAREAVMGVDGSP
jgi:hypothetical protein